MIGGDGDGAARRQAERDPRHAFHATARTVEQDHDGRAPLDGDCSIANGQVAGPDGAGPVT